MCETFHINVIHGVGSVILIALMKGQHHVTHSMLFSPKYPFIRKFNIAHVMITRVSKSPVQRILLSNFFF